MSAATGRLRALAALEAPLLVDGPLRGRIRLEPVVWNRIAAFDREPVLPIGKPLFRSRHRLELLLKPLAEALVALFLEELGCLVRRMLILVGKLAVSSCSRPQRLELSFDTPSLGCEQLLCACRVHRQRS